MSKGNIPELKDESVQKIMDLLNHEFNDLKSVIDDRISIRKDCDDKIKQALSGEEENKEDNLNKAEIKILRNGLLESGESEADKEKIDKIKHDVIVRYLQEKIVVDLFMRCVEKAWQGTNDDFTNLFIENCGFLQEVEFDLEEINGNEKIPEKIEISKGTISKIADFVNKCWSNMKE